MALIPSFFLDTVISIGIPHAKGTTWVGTGFIAGKPMNKHKNQKSHNPQDQTKYSYRIFLVTNKHLIENERAILLRFNDVQGLNAIDFRIELKTNDKPPIWHGHPNQDIDVAVLPINPNHLTQNKAQLSFFDLDLHALTTKKMKEMGVSEGDPIFLLGYPMGNVSIPGNYNFVISRSGSIARIRDVLNGSQTSFLIDASVFPGNSGGPVVIRPEMVAIKGTSPINTSALIGIVKSYIPFRDVAASLQTGQHRIIFEENSGLAVVETVDSIEETINSWLEKNDPANNDDII